MNVVTSETDLKPGAKVLKLQNTIIEYAKGGGAARYFAGLYGAGQPVLRVQGKLAEGDKQLFSYEARRSGVSAGARMTGAFMTDVDIQQQDIQSMVLDLPTSLPSCPKKRLCEINRYVGHPSPAPRLPACRVMGRLLFREWSRGNQSACRGCS